MSRLIRKSHNVSILLYHFVCPAKYRRAVIDDKVDQVLKEVCLDIADRYEIEFLEIGTDKDHVHFLVQSVPSYSPTKIITMIKSLTAREIFARVPSVKKQLWGGEFWTDGYYVGTVGQHATEDTIKQYVKNQGQEEQYVQLHVQQLKLF
ncbi:MAG: IS200/IS605 family transposase [Chloroflexi bacterium]|nr:IS200/IS605 family transposase [Chloroflexota bacterium]